jgi:hypothetical protein
VRETVADGGQGVDDVAEGAVGGVVFVAEVLLLVQVGAPEGRDDACEEGAGPKSGGCCDGVGDDGESCDECDAADAGSADGGVSLRELSSSSAGCCAGMTEMTVVCVETVQLVRDNNLGVGVGVGVCGCGVGG